MVGLCPSPGLLDFFSLFGVFRESIGFTQRPICSHGCVLGVFVVFAGAFCCFRRAIMWIISQST